MGTWFYFLRIEFGWVGRVIGVYSWLLGEVLGEVFLVVVVEISFYRLKWVYRGFVLRWVVVGLVGTCGASIGDGRGYGMVCGIGE